MARMIVPRLRRPAFVLKVLCTVAVFTTTFLVLQKFKVGTTLEQDHQRKLAGLGKETDTLLQDKQPNKHLPQKQFLLQEQVQKEQQNREHQLAKLLSKELEESKMRQEARHSRAKKYCLQKASFEQNGQKIEKTNYTVRVCPLVSERHNSIFCPIAKIGSTFWTRFYNVLSDSGSDELRSPYTVPLDKVESTRCGKKLSKVLPKEQKALKVMFVREPFSRLFSAYVDKLISPNPTYWGKWGRSSMTHDGMSQSHVRCGQNVTFRQFARYVNKRLHTLDNHVIPMMAQCDVCKENFDVIGTMESFSGDLKYIMNLLNVTFKPGVQLSRDTKLDAIYDSIQGPFGWMKKIRTCISTPEMGRRIWRKLQIRGLISSRIDYPLGSRNLTEMKVEEFYQVAVEAHDKSTDKRLLSQQKKQAIIEAFRTLSMEDIRKYVEIFKDDFEAFGYERTSSWVFDRDFKFTDTKSMNWNNPWIIPAHLL